MTPIDGDRSIRAGRPAGAAAARPSPQARVRAHPGLGAGRHRPGGGVRLRGHPGLPRAARRGRPHDPRQLQPGDDHDRPVDRRRGLPRAAHGAGDRGGHRPGEARGPAGGPRRPDGAQPRDGAGRGRASWSGTTCASWARRSRRSGWPRTARRSATCWTASGSRTRPRSSWRARTTRPATPRREEALDAIGLPAIIRPAFTLGGTGGGIVETEEAYWERVRAGLRSSPDQAGHDRALPRGLAGDRVRGHARRRGHVHRRVLDGERGPARRPHRRLDRGGAGADAHRHGPPAAPERRPRDHPGAGRRGRLQRPVRALAGLDRIRGHRGQPARVALVGAGVQGDGLPDRARRGPDRRRPDAGRDPQRGDRDDGRGLRARAGLRRGQAAALPVRQVPRRGPQPRARR